MSFTVGLVIHLKERAGMSHEAVCEMFSCCDEGQIFSLCHGVGYKYPTETQYKRLLKLCRDKRYMEAIINAVYMVG